MCIHFTKQICYKSHEQLFDGRRTAAVDLSCQREFRETIAAQIIVTSQYRQLVQ